MDNKQHRLITSWVRLADQVKDEDAYSEFIALWIAFNAFCYAKYASEAVRRRADIRKARPLDDLRETVPAVGVLQPRPDRIRLELNEPDSIRIDFVERYTEDFVFERFSAEYDGAYGDWLRDESFLRLLGDLQAALRKPDGVYVVNMLKAHELRDAPRKLAELAARNVIVRFDVGDNLRALKDVLYQVRCNVFHGEKVPGELNDDRIVRAAAPLLRELLSRTFDH